MRINIDVFTPGNGKYYEFVLDDRSTVGQVKKRLIEEISEYEAGQISLGDNPELFNMISKERLLEHRNLRKAGVRSGQVLILV